VECERLQGFPDDWTKYGLFQERPKRIDLLFREKNPKLWAYKTKQVNAPDVVLREISMSQRYKMCGNSVTTNVVKEIGKRLLR
jgi:DNA (cytosine-5)-methyltransferase 1